MREVVTTKLNLEMAATDEMIAIAIGLKPQLAMFVPEKRQEVTTEGGLDVAAQEGRIRDAVARLKDAGVPVSAFIDAESRQVEAAAGGASEAGAAAELMAHLEPRLLATMRSTSFAATPSDDKRGSDKRCVHASSSRTRFC